MPLKHHYNPQFYLSRWAGEDGRLCQYSKPRDVVVPNRKYPSQTGFQERLYEMAGHPPDVAQQVESRFMQPLDTLAAEALVELENNDPVMERDPRLRSAWSRFIMSMMLRGPEAMQALKRGIAAHWQRAVPELEAKYAHLKGPDDPPNFADYMAKREHSTDAWAMSLAPYLIDHNMIGDLLNNMRWFIRRIGSDTGELLTSDQPILMSATLTEEHAYLFLPIGPKAMFVAVNDVETQDLVEARDPEDQLRGWNQYIAGRAVRYSYARDDSVFDFVSEHFGKHPRRTLLEELADRYAAQTPGA